MNGLGSPLPGVATPRGRRSQHRLYIFQQNSIAHNYIIKQNSIARIYFSWTASRVYISAEQHRPYILQQNSILCLYTHPGSGDPWEWQPVTLWMNQILLARINDYTSFQIHFSTPKIGCKSKQAEVQIPSSSTNNGQWTHTVCIQFFNLLQIEWWWRE